MSSFGAPLDQVWGFGSEGGGDPSGVYSRNAPGSSSSSSSANKKKNKGSSGGGSVYGRSCDDLEGLDGIMNMHACTGNSSRPKSKPKKCPPAPPSSPRRPARKADPPNAPPQWVPIDTPSTIPRPLLEEPNSYDGSGASWGSAFNDSVAPFGFWDSEGRAEKRSFDLPSSSAHSSSSKPSSSTPDEVNNDQLYVGDAPAFLSAIPQFADGDTIIPSPKPLQAEKSDFACSDEEEDHDEFAEEEEEAFDDEDDDYETKKRASSSSQQKAQGVASSAGANKLDGRTFAADMTVYVVSGILLIFVMEQFVQIGMRLN